MMSKKKFVLGKPRGCFMTTAVIHYFIYSRLHAAVAPNRFEMMLAQVRKILGISKSH